MNLNDVLAYPANSHERRHGPLGYVDYKSYKPWLRDEFTFRCVYCLGAKLGARMAIVRSASTMFARVHCTPSRVATTTIWSTRVVAVIPSNRTSCFPLTLVRKPGVVIWTAFLTERCVASLRQESKQSRSAASIGLPWSRRVAECSKYCKNLRHSEAKPARHCCMST